MSRVPAAQHTLRILTHLARQRGPQPAARIAEQLGLPRSSVYHLLTVMAEQGFVVHFPEARRFGLGIAAYELSSGFARHEPLSRMGRPVVASLVDRIGESVHLAVLRGRDVVYIVEERAPRRPVLVTDVGVRLPAHLTASGRALLAALPRAQVRALYPAREPLEQHTGSGPRSARELTALLVSTRARGHSTEDGEITEGFASVGVAVRDHTGWPLAAIAATYPRENVDAERETHVVSAIAAAAGRLARRLRAD